MPKDSKHAANHGDKRIVDRGNIHHNRHHQTGIALRCCCGLLQIPVEPVKFSERVRLMAEHLDNLLSGNNFLNISVDAPEICLLCDKIFTAGAHQAAGDKEHDRRHQKR